MGAIGGEPANGLSDVAFVASKRETERAAAVLVGRHLGTFVVSFVGTVFLVRTLGPEIWGTYAIAYVALVIGQQLVERGAVAYIVRQQPGDAARIGDALALQCGLGGIAALVTAAIGMAAATWLVHAELAALFVANAVTVFAYSIRAVRLGILERAMDFKRVGLLEFADVVAFNVVALTLVVLGAGISGLIWATLARALAAILLATPVWRHFRFSFPIGRAREILSFVLPFTAWNALSWFNLAAAPILVAGIRGPGEFAILQLAYSLIVYPQTLAAIFARIEYPMYSRLAAMPNALARRVSRGTAIALVFGGLAVMLFAATAVVWVPTIYGSQWFDVAKVMILVAPTYVVSSSLNFVVLGINARTNPNKVAGIGLAYTVVYWTLASVLVPRLGMMGIPLAYSIALSVNILYLPLFQREVGPLTIRSAMIRFVAIALTAPLAAIWASG